MVDLKEQLIKKIQETSDTDVLKEVYRLLEVDFDDQETYKLTEEQKTIISVAQQQIEKGDSLTNEESNEMTEQWLAQS